MQVGEPRSPRPGARHRRSAASTWWPSLLPQLLTCTSFLWPAHINLILNSDQDLLPLLLKVKNIFNWYYRYLMQYLKRSFLSHLEPLLPVSCSSPLTEYSQENACVHMLKHFSMSMCMSVCIHTHWSFPTQTSGNEQNTPLCLQYGACIRRPLSSELRIIIT